MYVCVTLNSPIASKYLLSNKQKKQKYCEKKVDNIFL